MRLCFLFLALAAGLSAAPLRQELGDGLTYFRAHELPADLPAAEAAMGRANILDLRYVSGSRAAANGLTAWLNAHASLHAPVILLANAETGAALLANFMSAKAIPGLIVIGPRDDRLACDISVAVDPKRERAAYDALESGIPVAKLLDDNPEKARNDEARLAKDHLSDGELASSGDTGPLHDSPPVPGPLVDAVLLRAVQFYHTLLALKRL
jgi:hypothetical protein